MRILPYGSAAVKVRVEGRVAKLGLFLGTWSARRGGPGSSAARPSNHLGQIGWTDGGVAGVRDRGIGKVCAKSRTRISDTDL
jgi:hypothetical protein